MNHRVLGDEASSERQLVVGADPLLCLGSMLFPSIDVRAGGRARNGGNDTVTLLTFYGPWPHLTGHRILASGTGGFCINLRCPMDSCVKCVSRPYCQTSSANFKFAGTTVGSWIPVGRVTRMQAREVGGPCKGHLPVCHTSISCYWYTCPPVQKKVTLIILTKRNWLLAYSRRWTRMRDKITLLAKWSMHSDHLSIDIVQKQGRNPV